VPWRSLGFLLVSVACVAVSHQALLERREAIPDAADVTYVPPPAALRPMSLGFREALADLIWLRALIFSGERIDEHDNETIGRYVDAVTGLSPRFHRAYVWGGVTFIYGGTQEIPRDAVDRAIAVYRAGLREFPESHQLLFPLGMILIHQVRSTPGYSEAERKAMATEGAELVRKAAAYGADPLVRQYAATLVSDHASKELARRFLENQLATVEDEEYRFLLLKKLRDLGADAAIPGLERIRREFQQDHEQQLPYVPSALFAVLRDEHANRRSTADAP